MNRKGFIDFDEINPAYLALALVAAIISVIVTAKVQVGLFWKIATPIVTFAASYFYLVLTDR